MGRRRRRRVSRRKNRPAPKKKKKLGNLKGPRRSIKKKVVKKTPKYRSRKEGLKANQQRIANKKKTESKKTRPSRRRNVPAARPAPKSNMQRIRDAARKRHENFKKTGVQTFGGTRKNYSKREAEKIRNAGLNFSKVTGGAKNPLARPPANPNVKPGELMPQVQSFSDSLGLTDLSKNAAPMVNYNFSQRDTSLPSMGQLAKTDLSGFSRAVGADRRISGSLGSRKAFSARPDSNLNMRDLFQAKDLGNMTTNAINTMVDKIPIIGERLPNLMPMSMTDRDRQKYLGYNPNKPSGYLKQQERKRSRGGVSRIQQQVAAQQTQQTQPDEITEETQLMSGTDPDNLTRIQNQAYNTALSNNLAGLAGNFNFGPQGTQMAISQAPGLQAGKSRGRKQIRRFGRGRKRGAGDAFRRGGRRIQQFTSTQLNI